MLLRQLPELNSLVIDNTGITDSGIYELRSNSIGLIGFANCNIEGSGFSSWKNDGKMSFYCDGSALTDNGFGIACSSFTQMWNVIISNTNVGDVGIKALSGQTPTMLRINRTRITNAGVRWIIDSLPVEGLEIDSSQMSAAEIASCQRPRKLDVRILE